MVPRTLATALETAVHSFPVVTVTGPRQSGKTTLLRAAFPDYHYVNLEAIDQRRMAEEDPRGLIGRHIERGIVIDEAQRVPDLFSYVQTIVDGRRTIGKVILSGSQHFLLDGILPAYGLSSLTDGQRNEMNRFWHRLDPWPDARSGLARLKERYTIATLSNGNVALLTNMARHADLPWDCILSAELFGHYKPDAQVYLGAARLLGLEPSMVMMVAAHTGDLRAAAECGFRTAFVPRPEEYGDRGDQAPAAEPWIDLVAPDFPALADTLGA
ncbi:MAG: HAD-IA family hydrolase [Spirochaetota bacterium]